MRTTNIVAVVLVVIIAIFAVTPDLRVRFNNWRTGILKADETTVYENINEVEDTCRAMIASYEADKIKAETYSETHPDWAEQAKIRANQTASTYNNYMLKNSFKWAGNIPVDIKTELELIK